MDPLRLQEGTAYYRITWADPKFTIPGVEPFIYVGLNIMHDDDPTNVVHYFQDTISYELCGAVTNPEKLRKHAEVEPYVVHSAEGEIGDAWVDLAGAIAQMQAAQIRATQSTGT